MFTLYVASMLRLTVALHNLINNREDMKINDKLEIKEKEEEKIEKKEIEVKN